MDSIQTITTYEAILATTNKMLTAAQKSEWEQLVLLEKECRALAQKLVQEDTQPVLSPEQQQKKVQMIRQILSEDAEIRKITEPWMSKLQEMIGSTGRTRSLNQAYQPNQNH